MCCLFTNANIIDTELTTFGALVDLQNASVLLAVNR